MLGTYLLYLAMSSCGPLLVKSIVNKSKEVSTKQWINVSLVLIILSIIIGGRYEVGTDFPNYVDYYKSFIGKYSKFEDILVLGNSLEPGYLFINWAASELRLSVSMFFTLIAFFSFVLMFKAQKDRPYLWPLILFFFFGQMFATSMNIVRQSCAIFLFFYAVPFIGKNKLKLFLLITSCCLFHYSAVVFYLALFIESKRLNFLDSKKLIVLLFLVSWGVASYILPIFMKLMPLDMFSAKYLSSLDNSDIEMSVSSGLGILVTKVVDILLIYQSDRVIEHYKDEKIKFLYRLYFVGIILSNIMGISMYLSRIFLGMVLLRIFVMALTTYYCLKFKNIRLLLGIFLIMLSIVQLIMTIKNGNGGISPYQFMWQ